MRVLSVELPWWCLGRSAIGGVRKASQEENSRIPGMMDFEAEMGSKVRFYRYVIVSYQPRSFHTEVGQLQQLDKLAQYRLTEPIEYKLEVNTVPLCIRTR